MFRSWIILVQSCLPVIVLSSSTRGRVQAFVTPHQHPVFPTALSVTLQAQDLAKIGYVVKVTKPLGLIFGENDEYGGLVVDDVEPGLSGGAAGIKAGDQLLAVDADIVVGDGFDAAMGVLRTAANTLELRMFRGSVEELNLLLFGTDEPLLVESEQVIMDENYESPVVVPIDEDYDDSKLTAGDFFNGLKKLASSALPSEQKQEKKKGGGFFGGMFGGETVQLDGDDASTLK
jgi:hypothetical protein